MISILKYLTENEVKDEQSFGDKIKEKLGKTVDAVTTAAYPLSNVLSVGGYFLGNTPVGTTLSSASKLASGIGSVGTLKKIVQTSKA